jgi:RNA polymerase sigma factor (sigma-70 family)
VPRAHDRLLKPVAINDVKAEAAGLRLFAFEERYFRRDCYTSLIPETIEALFLSNLGLIDRVIGGVCRRGGVFGADADDFASTVKLALLENDYAILRLFVGRSSLSTFLTVVVQRLLSDERTREKGRWHASREAERLGPAAIALERIVHGERRTIDEALPILRSIDPALTRERVVAMSERLPLRAARTQVVELESGEWHLASASRTDDRAIAEDQAQLSDRIGAVVRDTLEAMPLEDRMIVRFHFGEEMTMAEISGLLRLPQRPLYRRRDALLQRFRNAFAAAGIDARDAGDLIGDATREMDFGLQHGKSAAGRRTTADDMTHEEEAR